MQYMMSVIMMSFHSYKLKDLKLMTRNELIELFVIVKKHASKTNPNYQKLIYKKYMKKITM